MPESVSDAHSVLATQAIANVVKSSFGPSGLDKMMVDDIGVWERLANIRERRAEKLNSARKSP